MNKEWKKMGSAGGEIVGLQFTISGRAVRKGLIKHVAFQPTFEEKEWNEPSMNPGRKKACKEWKLRNKDWREHT